MIDPDYNPVVPSHVSEAVVYDYNIYDYQTKDPFVVMSELTDHNVPEIFWTRNNGGHWIVRTPAGATAMSTDPVLFSASRMMVPDRLNADVMTFPPNDVDPPLHKQFRAVVAPMFTPSRIALVEGAIEQISENLIDQILEKGECEFISDFASHMPVIVFLKLLDLPLEDRARLRAIAQRVLLLTEENSTSTPLQELSDYLAPYLKDRSDNPKDDVLSHIIAQQIDGRDLLLDEMTKLARSTLLGGLDTVPSMLAYFARYLADNPDARQRLISAPQIIKHAVEEILRRFPPSHIARVLMKDTEFKGVLMKQGDHAVWSVGMYNLNKTLFPDPLVVNFDRKRTPNATFGIGEHFCVGSNLARAELRIFAERWLARIPNFHVRTDAIVKYRGGFIINYDKLPLVVG